MSDDTLHILMRLAAGAPDDARGPDERAFCDPYRSRGPAAAAQFCDLHRGREGCHRAADAAYCAHHDPGVVRAARRQRLSRAGVPAATVKAVLDPAALQPTDALRIASEWLTGDGWALVLSGMTGCGKSVAAAWAIAERGGLWLRARDLANVNVDLSDHATAHLLVVDDLGTEYNGERGYAVARACDLLEGRADDGRRTVITTNMRVRDGETNFAARYGDRLCDRLREGGRWSTVAGASLRGGAA